tara:strand:+ start:54 stop:524 length:471 start_codon:yes stop_codon:yes gene_type:complete
MKIELKNVKYAAFASEETSCYSASLYVNGKKIGEVSNEGHGGPDAFYGDRAAYKAADEWCRANLPKWSMHDDDDKHDTDLEMHCGTLLTNSLLLRDYKRDCRTKVLFTKPNEKGIWSVKHKGDVQATIERLLAQRPDLTIINGKSDEEVLETLRQL